jgi:hypothetical protein
MKKGGGNGASVSFAWGYGCVLAKGGGWIQSGSGGLPTFQFDAISVRQIQNVVADFAPHGHFFALGCHVRNVDTGG